MRKFFPFLIIILLLIPGYFLFEASHPKTAGRFPFMVFLLAVDIYLWYSFRKKILKLKGYVKYLLTFLYWLPLTVFIGLISVSLIRNVNLLQPALVSYITGIVLVVYFSKLIIVIFFFLADIYRILLFIIRHAWTKKTGKPVNPDSRLMSRGRFLKTAGLATGGVIFSGMLIGMVKWAHDFRVRQVNLTFPKLPVSFDGFRIVQISDLHLGSWATINPVKEAIAIINDLDPDLVLFTGDLVNYSTEEAFLFRNSLSGIHAAHGVYTILGNHDYGDYVNWPSDEAKQKNLSQLYEFFREINWNLLNNESVEINNGSEKIILMGVENWSSNSRFPKLGDMQKALHGTQDSPFKILMSHDPSHWEKEVSQIYPDIDLTLSGHTHGFQVGVELKNFRWSPAQYGYKYWAGLYQINHPQKPQYLYVNRGLGMIGYPGRVGILPEITLITLQS